MRTLKRMLLFVGLKIAELIGLCFAVALLTQLGFLFTYYILVYPNPDRLVGVWESDFYTAQYFPDAFIGIASLALIGIASLALIGMGSYLICVIIEANWEYVKKKIK